MFISRDNFLFFFVCVCVLHQFKSLRYMMTNFPSFLSVCLTQRRIEILQSLFSRADPNSYITLNNSILLHLSIFPFSIFHPASTLYHPALFPSLNIFLLSSSFSLLGRISNLFQSPAFSNKDIPLYVFLSLLSLILSFYFSHLISFFRLLFFFLSAVLIRRSSGTVATLLQKQLSLMSRCFLHINFPTTFLCCIYFLYLFS